MIQQSQIPTNVPLRSISPEENYSRDEESSSTPLSSSSDAPTAAARKTQFGKPNEQQQNSSGLEDNAAKQRGRTARARPARVGQDEEEEQAVPSVSKEEEEAHSEVQTHMRPSSTGDQVGSIAAANPREITASPISAHTSPGQVLSPTGYILGFVQADSNSCSSNPQSPPQSPTPTPTAPGSETQSSEHTAESASRPLPHNDDKDAARSAAVQLLLGFMGALQASQYAVESFVSNVVHHYR